MRYLIFLFLCIYSYALQAGDHPYPELDRFFSHKTWIIEKYCINDTCYGREDSSYYWSSTFSNIENGDRTAYGFTWHNMSCLRDPATGQSVLVYISCTPYFFILNQQEGQAVYQVRFVGEGYNDYGEIRIINDHQFVVHLTAPEGDTLLKTFVRVIPPAAVAEYISD